MLRKAIQVDDVTLQNVLETKYSAAFFATGFESRCTTLSELLDTSMVREANVWGFSTEVLPALRRAHDLHFKQKWNVQPLVYQSTEFAEPWKRVRDSFAVRTRRAPLRLLVDYSSMARMWYGALLNYHCFLSEEREVSIDFCYTPGRYSAAYAEEMKASVVSEIISIPGMEGLSATRESSVVALGLGFTPAAALGVLERLQAHSIVSFFANPGGSELYTETCQKVNSGLIAASQFVLQVPLQSVSTAYRRLCEALTPYLDGQRVTFIPMGPKPHVLASMLVASRFKQVGCMYAQLTRRDVSDIPAGALPTGVRVTLRRI